MKGSRHPEDATKVTPLGDPENSGPSTKKKFTPAEDQYLAYLVSIHGSNNWKRIAWNMPDRTVRQCRERWKYYLEPNINHQVWTKDEDRLLMEKFQEFGPCWARMTNFFRNRTDIDLKNRYHRLERSNKRNQRQMNAVQTAQTGKTGEQSLRVFKLADLPVSRDDGNNIATNISDDIISSNDQDGTPSDPKNYYLEQMSINNLLNK